MWNPAPSWRPNRLGRFQLALAPIPLAIILAALSQAAPGDASVVLTSTSLFICAWGVVRGWRAEAKYDGTFLVIRNVARTYRLPPETVDRVAVAPAWRWWQTKDFGSDLAHVHRSAGRRITVDASTTEPGAAVAAIEGWLSLHGPTE